MQRIEDGSRLRPSLWVGLALCWAACGGAATEGVNPGECSDGADNDADGYFDCNDSDCTASPDCAGGSVVDTNTGTDDGSGFAPPVRDIKGFTLDRTVSFSYGDLSNIPGGGCVPPAVTLFCDCDMVFKANASNRIEADGTRLTFEGTFELDPATTCIDEPNAISYGSLWFPDDGQAFHTLRLSSDGSQVVEWIAHEFLPDIDLTDTPTTDGQHAESGLELVITPGPIDWAYEQVIPVSATTLDLSVSNTWTFQE